MGSDLEAGFAKLQGEDFEYYMQTYSIILGRNSKKSLVDVDLASLGCGMNISRHHARIFYDFGRRRFAMEVLGKNGCLVEGVLHLPGHAPVKLDSQDLLQIGDKEFYFLLPVRSIVSGQIGSRNHVGNNYGGNRIQNQQNLGLALSGGGNREKRRGRVEEYSEEEDGYMGGECGEDESWGGKRMRGGEEGDVSGGGNAGSSRQSD